MPEIEAGLRLIAEARASDPLRPVTVIAPSHLAALQLRRRLAELTSFAGVRFEPLARLAELIAAGDLAARGLRPLARPIGDLLTERVALESTSGLEGIRDLPGYVRLLRRVFRRLRQGGIRSPDDVPAEARRGRHLPEVLRLYGRFRQETSDFYDPEDILEAAARLLGAGRPAVLDDLGEVYAVGLTSPTAGEAAFLAALDQTTDYRPLALEPGRAQPAFVLAPDPASEARETVREVIAALEAGVPLHEVAIFHGADRRYPQLLREAFATAAMPCVLMPGTPASETPAGRGVLALVSLPELDYSRTAFADFLSIAPLKGYLPLEAGEVRSSVTEWDRLSREAGITHGRERWASGLHALILDRQASIEYRRHQDADANVGSFERDIAQAEQLLALFQHLADGLQTLRQPRPARSFVPEFRRLVSDYFDPEADGLDEVLEEIDQLGTVDAVGGSFSLESLGRALRANLEARYLRERGLGDGVLVADYRSAAGLRFRQVLLCGAFEGAFPSSAEGEALLEDSEWARLRQHFPHLEEGPARLQRNREAARQAVAAAGERLVWLAPLYEPASTREYYPSPLMVEAATAVDSRLQTASDLRSAAQGEGLRRGTSPLALALCGPLLDAAELRLRQAAIARRDGDIASLSSRQLRALELLRSRRGSAFTEWDGNLSQMEERDWLELHTTVSPTSLQNYATCGFRYLNGSLLRINVIEEPEERETMEPLLRGNLVHRILDRFFREQQSRGRPAAREAWTAADRNELWSLLDRELQADRERGLTGLDVFAEHELRTLRADLAEFLEADTRFRQETGAIPRAFETHIPEVSVAGITLRGIVDRIDRTPDGRRAWVIDYKTGSTYGYPRDAAADPFAGGSKLQLPVYLGAVSDAEEAVALYWFMTRKGGFEMRTYEPTPEKQQRFQELLRRILAGIRSGAFPAVPGEDRTGSFENCTFCDFDRICSRRRDEQFAAKQADPAMLPWHRVASGDET
ncbi:MAG TPA: PD-(D/E)XK nuclease family protein [Dehalococcoidia bacterium]|nr:PD-(D/E)XK nuclease family protein [Dehalococcoidia bacterium]